MKAIIQEVRKNNYVVDFSGIGVKEFEFTPQDLKEIIDTDLHTNFDCITYLSTLVSMEEGLYTATNLKDNTRLTIRLYMKTEDCFETENMMGVISSYLNNAFIRYE